MLSHKIIGNNVYKEVNYHAIHPLMKKDSTLIAYVLTK